MRKFYLGFVLGAACTMMLKKKAEDTIVTESDESVSGDMISDKLPDTDKSELRKDSATNHIEIEIDEMLDNGPPAFKPVITFVENNFSGSTIKFFSGLRLKVIPPRFSPAAIIVSKSSDPKIAAYIFKGDLNSVVILDANNGTSMITEIDNNKIEDFDLFINSFKEMIV